MRKVLFFIALKDQIAVEIMKTAGNTKLYKHVHVKALVNAFRLCPT